MHRISIVLLVLSLTIIHSCGLLQNRKRPDDVIARVGEKYLYTSDLDGLVTPGTSPEDSTDKVNAFVNSWVRQTLLLEKAELNLNKEMKSFEKELEKYRRTLIIYRYQELFVSQKLDTVVNDAEIEAYYKENPSNFELRKNIVKASFVVFSRKNKDKDKVRKWLQDGNDEEKLTRFCRESALKYNLNDSSWFLMEEIESDIPLQYSSQELFLSSRKFVELEDSSLTYMLKIHDYKIKESLSPLEFEKSRIRSIILNIRKRELLQKAEDDLYNDALQNKSFEIYINE